ncbi:MAG: FG-GAP-like repeat-containing protein, partial [Bacteroidota bacterium]
MKNTLYQALLSRLKNKHTKLASRFHKSVQDGEFQKQRYRKRKESVERLKSLEKRIAGFGKESGFKVKLNHKHWAIALAMGVVVSAKAQVALDSPVPLGLPSINQIHTGDLDGDGDLDGIFMTYASNPLILFNQGGLTFTQSSIPVYSAGFIGGDSYLGDFDGDGDLDLILSEGPYGSATFSAWLNDGLGNFSSSAVTIPAIDFQTGDVHIGDVDGDGDDDLVVQEDSPSYVNVFTNTNLTFTATRLYGPSLPNTQLKILMDADGDTDLDIILSAYDSGAYPLMVFSNNGSGVFSNGAISPIYNVNDVASLDIDNDSDLDLVRRITSTPGAASAQILVNNGSGSFTEGNSIVIPNNDNTQDLFPLDINNDNFDDIIINTEADSTFIYQSDGIGAFSEVSALPGVSIPGDLDGDSDGDLFYMDGDVSVVENQGGGSYVQGSDIFAVSVSYDTDLVDIDGDSDLDVVTGSQLQSRVWLNDGSANFTVGQEIGTQGYAQEFGDLDGDGDPDMIRLIEEGSNGGLDIWTNAGGMLTYNQNLGGGSFEFKGIALANIDGDSDLDIIAHVDAGFAKYLTVFRNDGGLVFTQNNVSNFYTQLKGLVVGDIDGDTDIDVVLGLGNVSAGFVPFTNDGAGTLTQGTTVLPPLTSGQVSDLDLADLDGDSDLDIFITNGNGNDHYRFNNNGSGLFTDSGQNITISGSPEQSFVVDIDNDGDNDIIFVGYASNPQIWLNDGLGSFSYDTDISAVADEYTKVVLGDLDGDTDIDVVTGGYYVGTNIFLNQAIIPVPEINVQGGGVNIVSGDTTPDAADGTDFGNGTIGVGVVTTFTIQNTGTADLNVTSLGVSGANPGDFAISNITTPAVVTAGTNISFDVTFNATASGARVATIDINNDDSDESMYSFDVAGNGQTEQEINIQGGGLDILSGDITPDGADGT